MVNCGGGEGGIRIDYEDLRQGRGRYIVMYFSLGPNASSIWQKSISFPKIVFWQFENK